MTDDYLRISQHQGNSHLESLPLQSNDGIALSDFLYTVAVNKGRKSTLQTLHSAQKHQMSWNVDFTGLSTASLDLVGEQRDIAAGLTANYSTYFSVGNQHIGILVNTVVAGGVITITGDSVSESSQVPVIADTETITIDTTADQLYQTDKKWLSIDSVVIDGGAIDTLDYDIQVIGYLDWGNTDVEIVGFRAEFRSANNTADIGIRIFKIQDDGAKKCSIVTMESIGVDSTAIGGEIQDDKRTGADLRDHTFDDDSWLSGSMFCFKQLDFETFFTSDENILECSSKAEGIHIDFYGIPSGNLTAVTRGTITLYFRYI